MQNDKPNLGFIGWRGMVGSVLMKRMIEEKDFDHVHTTFFSSSRAGEQAPTCAQDGTSIIHDAYDYKKLSTLDIILTTQGGAYSEKVHPQLRSRGWKGYWIDAASTFRMTDDARIVLDPLNKTALTQAIASGVLTFAGANCSTATLLLGLAGLFQKDLIQWLSFMSYQAISGAGAQAVAELSAQHLASQKHIKTANPSIIELTHALAAATKDANFPQRHLAAPLASNILPWIDSDLNNGTSREELKTMQETNKILAPHTAIPIDGICVRVSVLRSHSFGCTIHLKEKLPLHDIEKIISQAHPWIRMVDNTKEASLQNLTPMSTTGSLDVAVGRLRQSLIDPQTIHAFVITDQLLWGAAEPLRRFLRLLLEHAHQKERYIFSQHNKKQTFS